jgi:hypothetical protein
MRVSVFFYKGIDVESVIWRRLKKLASSYEHPFWIGGNMGFGATSLSWEEATTLAAKITVNILKSECSSVFKEMRLMIQEDD